MFIEMKLFKEIASRGISLEKWNRLDERERDLYLENHPMSSYRDRNKDKDLLDINSLGEKIASSGKGITNFWRWFGASKVVDSKGRPLVVYHGTNDSFDIFRYDKGSKFDSGFLGIGFYFTDSMEGAEDYCSIKKGKESRVMKLYLRIENPLMIKSSKPFLEVISDYLNIDINDYYFSYDDAVVSKDLSNLITEKVCGLGYDGIIFNHTGLNETYYVVYESNQIKSVNNNGNFSNELNINS